MSGACMTDQRQRGRWLEELWYLNDGLPEKGLAALTC
jgi:hypothetical protein